MPALGMLKSNVIPRPLYNDKKPVVFTVYEMPGDSMRCDTRR
jgi:hypothetical protein